MDLIPNISGPEGWATALQVNAYNLDDGSTTQLLITGFPPENKAQEMIEMNMDSYKDFPSYKKVRPDRIVEMHSKRWVVEEITYMDMEGISQHQLNAYYIVGNLVYTFMAIAKEELWDTHKNAFSKTFASIKFDD